MTQSTEIQIALLTERQRIADAAIKALQEERSRALLWGIITLGSGVLILAGWIFNAITTGGHIK